VSQAKNDPFSLAEQPTHRYLLGLVMQDAARKFEDEIIESLRPRIRQLAAQAFVDLRPHIEANLDFMAKNMTLNLTVNPPEPEE